MSNWLRRVAHTLAAWLGIADTAPQPSPKVVRHARKVRGGSTMELPHYVTIDGEAIHKPGYCAIAGKTYLLGRDA